MAIFLIKPAPICINLHNIALTYHIDQPEPPAPSPTTVVEPPGVGPINADKAGGLSGGAIAGIVLASAAVFSLILYAAVAKSKNKKDDKNDDNDLAEMDTTQTKKELAALDTDGDIGPNAPRNLESPDTTLANSFSDATSTDGSMSTAKMANNSANDYYAKNSLLPGGPDDDSIMTEEEHPSFLNETRDVEDTPGKGE
jgi:hypothetical protein